MRLSVNSEGDATVAGSLTSIDRSVAADSSCPATNKAASPRAHSSRGSPLCGEPGATGRNHAPPPGTCQDGSRVGRIPRRQAPERYVCQMIAAGGDRQSVESITASVPARAVLTEPEGDGPVERRQHAAQLRRKPEQVDVGQLAVTLADRHVEALVAKRQGIRPMPKLPST